MKKIFKLVLVALSFTITTANAQKFTEGDESLAFLKGETSLNLEYRYDNMMVGKITEEEYKKEKIADFNSKQPGKGERWAEKWVNSREMVYEPMFEELINKLLFKGKTGVTAGKKQSNAKYTLVVKTTMMEPGFNAVVMKVDPQCNFEFEIVENATKKVMAKAELKRVMGIVMNDNDWAFDPSNRIKECYAKAGKVWGKKLAKVLKP